MKSEEWICSHSVSSTASQCCNPSCSSDRWQINSTLSGSWALPGHCRRCTTSPTSAQLFPWAGWLSPPAGIFSLLEKKEIIHQLWFPGICFISGGNLHRFLLLDLLLTLNKGKNSNSSSLSWAQILRLGTKIRKNTPFFAHYWNQPCLNWHLSPSPSKPKAIQSFGNLPNSEVAISGILIRTMVLLLSSWKIQQKWR